MTARSRSDASFRHAHAAARNARSRAASSRSLKARQARLVSLCDDVVAPQLARHSLDGEGNRRRHWVHGGARRMRHGRRVSRRAAVVAMVGDFEAGRSKCFGYHRRRRRCKLELKAAARRPVRDRARRSDQRTDFRAHTEARGQGRERLPSGGLTTRASKPSDRRSRAGRGYLALPSGFGHHSNAITQGCTPVGPGTR